MEYHKKLEEQVAMLKKENKRLEDENASLWFLLDELEKSNIHNEEYKEMFEEVYDKLRYQSLMTVKAEGEA
tara:strand:+ start:31 stop:243 length:213 start_codon:yes stop_codon:yes gene_type:complete